MAATVESAFVLLDRASGPLRSIRREANSAQRALRDLGRTMDSVGSRQQTQGLDAHSRALDVMGRKAREAQQQQRGLGNEVARTGSQARSAGDAIARFGTIVTGLSRAFSLLKIPALIAGFGALVGAAGAVGAAIAAVVPQVGRLAGALAAVPAAAGAAIQGVAALASALGGVGGAISAGIQALSAAGTSQVVDQQRAAARALVQAQRGVRNAYEGVGDAQYNLQLAQRGGADAQRNLTEAHRQAVRQLTDMRMAAESAALGQVGASLSLRRARERLAETEMQAGASDLDIAEARLGVRQARLAVRQARIEGSRARTDARRALSRGVGGSDVVRDARRGLADSRRQIRMAMRGVRDAGEAVRDALQDVADAQRNAAEAMAQGTLGASAFAEAMRNLSPEAQTFVRRMLALRPALLAFRAEVGRDLFPRLGNAITMLADRALPRLASVFRRTGRIVGENAEGFARELTSPSRLRQLDRLGSHHNRLIDLALRGARNLVIALIDLADAARPFTEWLAETVHGWTVWARESAAAGRQTGTIAAYLSRVRRTMQQFGRIASNVWHIFVNISEAAEPLGSWILDSFEELTRQLRAWTGSTRGQERMFRFFAAQRPMLSALAGLFGDIFGALVRISENPAGAQLVQSLRTLVPPLERIVGNFQSGFGPAVIDALRNILEMFATLSAPGGPLHQTALVIGGIAGAFTAMANSIPGLVTAIGTLVAAATGLRILRFLGRLVVPGGGGRGGGGGGGGGGFFGGGGGRPNAVRGNYGYLREGGMTRREAARQAAREGGGGRLRQAGRLARLGGGPLAIAAGLGATVLGGHVGGRGGGALQGAATGAGVGAMVGSVIPGVGTLVGGAVGGVAGGVLGFLRGGQDKAQQREERRALREQRRLEAQTQDVGAGRGVVTSLQQAFDVNSQRGPMAAMRRFRSEFRTNFRKLGDDGKRELGAGVEDWIATLERGNEKQRRQARRMRRTVNTEFDRMSTAIREKSGGAYQITRDTWKRIESSITSPLARAEAEGRKSFTALQNQAVNALVSQGMTRGVAKAVVNSLDPDTQAAARRVDRADTRTSTMGAARGARIPGTGLQDTVPVGNGVIAAPGELIVNRHTEDRVNRVLSMAGTTLGREVAGESRPHSASLSYARLGERSGNQARPGDAGGAVTRADAQSIDVKGSKPGFAVFMAHFRRLVSEPSLYVMSGARPGARIAGSNRVSNHASGDAIDIATPDIAGKGPGQRTGASHPVSRVHGYIRQNIPSPPTRDLLWQTMQGGNHFNHIHWGADPNVTGTLGAALRYVRNLPGVAADAYAGVTAGGAGAPAAQRINLRRHRVSGLGGVPAQVAQNNADIYRIGLQRAVNATLAGGGATGGGATSAGGTYDKARLVALARQVGMPNPNLMAAIALAESSGNPRALGIPTTGGRARGLWQIMWPLHASRFPGMDPYNPNDNAQMAKSILQSQGLGAWEAYTRGMHQRFMAHGGRVGESPEFAGWFKDGGQVTANRPTLIGIGDGGGSETATIVRGGGGRRGASVTIQNVRIENHREGDIQAQLQRELQRFIEEIESAAADESAGGVIG